MVTPYLTERLRPQLRQTDKPTPRRGILRAEIDVYGVLDVARLDVLGRVVLVHPKQGIIPHLGWLVVILAV